MEFRSATVPVKPDLFPILSNSRHLLLNLLPIPLQYFLPAAATNDLTWFWSIATCVKLLLTYSYHSTDFEVHRHWLALTSSLPVHRWYTDRSSPWTLDYPPSFAYFEYLLSFPASLMDPTIVDLTAGQNYAPPSAVLFQRLSVAFSDLTLLVGTHLLTRRHVDGRRRMTLALVIWSPALLIVDHIHFRYNGFSLEFS